MKKITFLLALFLVLTSLEFNAQTYLQENFDVEIPATWTVTDEGAAMGDSWVSGLQDVTNSLNGTNVAFVDSDTNGNGTQLLETLTSPVFDTTGAVLLYLDFDQFFNNNGAADFGVVEVFDGTNWIEVLNQNVDLGAFDAPDSQHIDITAYSNAAMQIRFVYNDGDTWAWYWLLDDIIVYNSTCDFPSGITVDNITDISADITWVTGGSESNWEVVVQAAGTGEPAGSGTATMTNNPYGVSGLTAITDYEVWVRTDCGTDGFSFWSGPINFRTFNTPPPAPVGVTCATGSSSFIYTAEFDTFDGWTGDLTNTNQDGFWEVPNDSGSGGTGADAAFSGTSFMNYESSGGTTATASAVSPSIDLTSAIDGAELSFYMHAFGLDTGDLNVGISNSAAGPFTNLFTWSGDLQTDGAQPWVPIGINLDAYLGQIIFVEFSYAGTGGFEGDISIDLMRVETCGSFCIAPSSIVVSNVGGTSADIDWNGNNGEASWEYVVSTAGTGEPTGSVTVVGATTINETGLDFSTDYEVWLRADCGGGVFSSWAGPINFTTTIQTDFTIDCTQAPTQINYCYLNNDTTNWVFTSSDGSPIRITFNSGTIEGGFDELSIYDGTDNTGTLLFNSETDGILDFAGITFDSVGDSLFMEVDSDGSVSCESGARLEWDFTVSCATCVNPAATYNVVSNCVVGPEFFVDVDLTDLGSATSITINDNQGSAPQTVAATGIVTFGPFANNVPVVITVSNDDDANCELTSSALTQELCLDTVVDCTAGPIAGFICYDNGNSVILTYTSTNGLPLNLTFNDGEIEGAPFDFLLVTDGNGTVLYNDEGNDGDLSGLTFQSITDTITIQILSDGSVSCTSGAFPNGVNFTVACATCINPAATYQVVDDCANGQQFLIDVNVTTLGDATSLTISNNIDAITVPVTAVGVYQIGPFPFLLDVIVTVSNDQDANCVINSSAIQLLACPPDNDNPCNATIAVVNTDDSCTLLTPGSLIEATPSGVPDGTCTGDPDDDVWFEFVAESEVQLISILNIAGGTFNIDHAIYEGACDNLVELECNDAAASVSPQLVVGDTYYIRVFSGGSDSETSTFDLCIKDAPTNIICENAENFCEEGGALTTSNIIGIPDNNQIACLGTAPNPTWNIIQIGDPGLIEIEIAQEDDAGNGLDVDFVLWGPFVTVEDACLNIVFDDCPTCPNNTNDPAFYPFGNIVDCSYDAADIENLTIDNALTGEIYMLLVTNFSDDPGTISISQTNTGDPSDGNVTAEIEVALGQDQQLCGFASYDIIADSPFADRYEWYCDGFIIPGEETSVLTVTDSCTYTVIAFDDNCQSQAQDDITVTFGAEPVANPVADIITCDDASADEIEDFDLEIQTATILGTQDPADFNVTYHLTLAEAQQGINPLTSPYTNISNPQTIYVRVEDAGATFCFATSSFDLIISGPTPTVNSVVYSECDDDFDGVTLFDLASQNGNVLGGQSAADFIVTYHETLADADSGSGAIDTSSLYSSDTTTIFVRIESNLAFDCYSTGTLELVVDPLPNTTFTIDFDYEVCPNAITPIQIAATANNYLESEVTINWYLDGGIIAGQNGLTLPVVDAGLYEIEVINNQTQCFSIAEQIVIELPTCVIPEGISPNGDGKNDSFDLSSYGVTKLEIFNRNGTLVYKKENYTNEWFGQTDDGDELPVGTYFYTMEYQDGKQRTAWVYIQRLN